MKYDSQIKYKDSRLTKQEITNSKTEKIWANYNIYRLILTCFIK